MTAARKRASEIAAWFPAGDRAEDPSGDIAVLARDYLALLRENRDLVKQVEAMQKTLRP